MTEYADTRSRYDEDADAFFRADADACGYSAQDPHAPGFGRGLYAYYRDNGMLPPEELERVIPTREFTGQQPGHTGGGPFDFLSTRVAAGITGDQAPMPAATLYRDRKSLGSE